MKKIVLALSFWGALTGANAATRGDAIVVAGGTRPSTAGGTPLQMTAASRDGGASAVRAGIPSASRAATSGPGGNAARASMIPARAGGTPSFYAGSARSATAARGGALNMSPATLSRAGVARATVATNAAAMGTTYNTCRNNYFTCMDQFCAQRDDTYRRCMCSARLPEVREMQRVLKQTQQQLADFHDYNIDSVDKTSGEVKAMLSASAGEYALYKSRENSDSVNRLEGISAILAGTRTNALSTAGTLDIAGDINMIWNTTDFISGGDIATLESDKLYNAVHNQCYEMVVESCGNQTTLNMVVSAYGMLIEQDCNTLSDSLNQKKTEAQSAIRQTERDLNVARLDNYDIHNAAEINECIAQVRKDLTEDTACGANYVHCLDVTGKFLNYVTGEPIYSPEFYRLETQLSLDGDILRRSENQLILSVLNNKRTYAQRGLDTCRDIADDVWGEFLRQALAEIYQKQQQKIRQVKDECIAVVTDCYDAQRGQLKDFSIQDSQALLGQAVELTEELCRVKMETCSNLYAGGPSGMDALLNFVYNVQTAVIADDCERYLNESINEYCSFALDAAHPYPYSCRVKPSGSWDCQTTTAPDGEKCQDSTRGDSLYNTISILARENCVRPSDNSITETTLPADVQKSVNSVFDRLYSSMWGVLGGICSGMGGEWVNALQTVDGQEKICISNLTNGCPADTEMGAELKQFKDTVFSHKSWGQCERTYCNMVGDMYIWNGKKRCCEEGYVWDAKESKCKISDCAIVYPGSRLDSECTGPEGGDDPMNGDDLPIQGGCITNGCRCDADLVYFKDTNDEEGKCQLFNCTMVGAVRDDRCTDRVPIPGGCLMAGCRCKDTSEPSYKTDKDGGYVSICE